jgi:hypothetical protein
MRAATSLSINRWELAAPELKCGCNRSAWRLRFSTINSPNFGKWCGTRSRQWAPHVYRCTAPLFWRLVLTRKPRDSRLVPVGSHGLWRRNPGEDAMPLLPLKPAHFSGPSYANSPSATVAGRFIACILSNRRWSAAGAGRTAAAGSPVEITGGPLAGLKGEVSRRGKQRKVTRR